MLRSLLQAGQVPGGRALVPGCGAGHDVFALAADDRQALGLELAPTAAARFETLREGLGIGADQAAIEVGDFFSYEPEQPFDVIWDYTFLCAIEPAERQAWARQMDRLLAPNGELYTLIFPVVDRPLNPGSPPHPLSPELVRGLLEPLFEAHLLEPVSTSHPGREGKEWLGRWRRPSPTARP